MQADLVFGTVLAVSSGLANLIAWSFGFGVRMTGRAFAVKVAPKRLPVFPCSELLKGCKGHKTHRFKNGGTNQIRKTGSRFAATFTAIALVNLIRPPH